MNINDSESIHLLTVTKNQFIVSNLNRLDAEKSIHGYRKQLSNDIQHRHP